MPTPRCSMRRAGIGAATIAAALALTACGSEKTGDQKGSSPTSGQSASASTARTHNQQDVLFAQDMIPHHRQAMAMAGLVMERASSERVKDLATRLEKEQQPQVTVMTHWLKAWHEHVPTDVPGMGHGKEHAKHHDKDHPSHEHMPGMMHERDMARMKATSGKAFDTMFLTMMIRHHQGAVDMATAEKEKGRYGPAKKLAEEIITAQEAEIAQMEKLLGKK